jgi:hypothetical protein
VFLTVRGIALCLVLEYVVDLFMQRASILLPNCVNLDLLCLVQGVEQEESKRSPSEQADEDCDNSGSVTAAPAPSEDPSEGHSSDSSNQCAGSDGGVKEVPEMDSKGSNYDNSECIDQSSPRAVLDISVSGSVDSDENSSAEQTAEPSRSLHWRNLVGGLILSRKKLMARAVTFPQRSKSSGLKRYLGRIRSGRNQIDCSAIAPEIFPEIEKWRPSWRSFDYDELCAATDRFSSGNMHTNFYVDVIQ